MEYNTADIMDKVLSTLRNQNLWFTTKNDPTYKEAPSYYTLDKYGDLTDKAIDKISKEVIDYIGDGAVEIDDAINIWIQDQCLACRLDFVDNLVTKFEPKPVVDNIEAYTSDKLNEDKSVSGMLTPIPDELLKDEPVKEWSEEDEKYYYDKYFDSRMDMYNDMINTKVSTMSVLKSDAENYNVQGLTFEQNTIREDIDKLAKAYVANKKARYEKSINKTENKDVTSLQEGLKTRLKEENNTSANLISSMFTAKDFDSDSTAGKIVMKTLTLFNALSDKGYDVQVAFDNGESQSAILLGEQGGKVIITITSPDKPLVAYVSGNFELNKNNLDILNDINSDIQNI